ncbi:MAG TPA: hypothetical protein DC054_05620 [Blastocatellia bacterium]|nr:hypothetical protein [Blastocatellia bacterium]
MSAIEYPRASRLKRRLSRSTIATIVLLSSLILVTAVCAKRSAFALAKIIKKPDSASVQDQILSSRESNQSPPVNVSYQTANTSTSSGSETWINFDNFQNGSAVSSGTEITNQYAPAIFSTDRSHYCVALSGQNYGSSLPNRLTRGPASPSNYGYAPLYVDFTQPVNDLRFYILAADDFRLGIAQINIFQNYRQTQSLRVDGFGNPFSPILVNLSGMSNITRIEVTNITDESGLSFDDFTFVVAPQSSPTPTPTPVPSATPLPPTNLIAEGDREKISMVWDNASDAASYNVNRKTTDGAWTRIATGVVPTPMAGGFWNRHVDEDVIPDTEYFYAVTAVNSNGESLDSNVVSARLLPSCGAYLEQRPGTEQITNLAGTGWSLTANVSDRDGLVLNDVSLNGRYMAEMMSVPYFFLKTNKMPSEPGAQRGELTPFGDAPTMRAHLYRYYSPSNRPGTNHIIAEYAVDHITATSKSCLLIAQDYEFDAKSNQNGDHCEPSDNLPCSRFYPRVSYSFLGRAGEVLESINIPERLHYRVNGQAENTIALVRDCDVPLLGVPGVGCHPGHVAFENKENPLVNEMLQPVVQNGQDVRQWDNLHQTTADRVEEPLDPPTFAPFGCPECVHTHWRWTSAVDYWYLGAFGYGRPIIAGGPFHQSHQDIDIGIVRYHPGEEHPTSFVSLVNNIGPNTESIRNPVVRLTLPTPRIPSRRIQVLGPADVVFWYSATSHEPDSDLFFKHGSFFNPDFHQQMTVPNSSGNTGNSSDAVQDGVRSIIYGHFYQEGATTFTNLDPSTLPTLPTGYTVLDNRAYKIATDAAVSGPHTIAFDVPSISDQTMFSNIAIFHLEEDPFDPDNMIWVDKTILSPDTPAPDFANRVINARADSIGYFAIGSLAQPQPDPGSSDLSVTINHSSTSVVVENNVSYTLHVSNAGPQTSMGVGIVDVLPQLTAFVSASSSQGTCKYKDGSVYCKMGTLPSGSTADVTIVVNTFEDQTGVPSEGKSIVNTAVVAGDNDDPSLDNNSATDTVTMLPNPNPRPTVTITSPTTGTTYTGPSAPVTIIASATGPSISKVDFYDGTALIGTVTSSSSQYQLSWNATAGPHTILAVATAANGRIDSSDLINIFVNGTATVSITSPGSNAVFDPSSNITVTANTTGPVSKVEFFANSISLGQGSGGNPYSVTWNNAAVGNYMLSAVVTDTTGATTTSAPINIAVTSRPNVTIISPMDGMTYPVSSRVALMATAQDGDGFISKVDFYANGSRLGTGSFIGQDRFSLDWTSIAPGIYSVTAVGTDNLGVITNSAPITVGVNVPNLNPGELIWFDDALPTGAIEHGEDAANKWYWVDANPAPLSGLKAHQSNNLGLVSPSNGVHKHYFDGATTTLPVSVGDRLFSYVFLDINNMPREIMLEWKDENGWEHRAYWGENNINFGMDGTNSRRYMGLMPKSGQWARLEVPANIVGLEGSTLNGMAFTLDGGRATWDSTGKATATATPPPPTPRGDSVWLEDGFPAGPIDTSDTVNDQWTWVANPLFSGQRAHQSQVTADHNTLTYRSHAFKGAQTPMQVNPGDVLFTYVLIDPSAKADQIMLQWYDGSSWEHRAFWGENFINHLVGGVQGTESQRYMGGVPNAQSGDCGIPDHPGWCRLEVPASYVGLEGKSVTGMAFSIFGKEPTVTWDRSGKADHSNNVFLPLSATAAVYSLRNKTLYAYDMNTRGVPNYPAEGIAFYAHPNQAARTVPFYRFHDFKGKFYYSTCRDCAVQAGWTRDGVAFYVYADGSTPGTVPLYEFHGSETFYYSVSPTAPAGMLLDGIVAYVYPNSGLVPRPPSYPQWDGGCNITWVDNSQDETGFEIKKDGGTWPLTEVPAGTVGPNVTSFNTCPLPGTFYTVRAHNSFGYSEGVGTCTHCMFSGQPPATANNPPSISIVAPSTGDSVDRDFSITANAFDSDGNGTIAKVEFFANGNKLGEVAEPPYIFTWHGAALGSYSLTANSTDSAGVTTTSSPVNVTVAKLDQTITFDPISDKTYGDTPFTISASASSGLPVTFSVLSGPATISGSTVTITGRGPVTVQAAQGGDENYNAAANVNCSFAVAKASARIALSNLSQTYDGTAKPVTATTNPTGLNGVSITYNGSPSAPTSTGSYSVVASLANDNYTAADANGTLTIGKASQTIAFDQLANKTYGDASFVVNALSSSGLAVSLSIASGPATILGNTVTLNGAGAVTVRVSQSGNENYNAATDVDRSFTVAKASATITLTNLNQNYDGTPKAVTATTNPSGLSGISIKYNGSSTAPSNAGSYPVVASLTNDNYTATDATGTLIINAPPTVSIASPTNGALLHVTSVSISASAADSDGSVSKVEFFQGSVKLGQVLSAPFSFIWNNVAGGTYSLTAVATDNSGSSTVSSPVSITVNNPPNISMTASSPQDIPTAPAQITINADASDPDGTISKVEFYQGTTLLATDVTSPYSFTWSNVGAGNYSFTAKATDNLGAVTTSNVVGILVNAKPSVSLTSPGGGASFFAPALVSLNATASDSDGSISKVEFYQGSILISTVTASPYSFNWSYVPAGTYTLTAKATDNIGASTTSNTVSITVTPSSVAIGKIAFASNRDGCAQIYLMNTDGTVQTCLSNGASNDDSPKWSPDNSRIAFQSDRDFQNDGDNPIYGMDIYVMNWDGSAPTRLTYATYDDSAPVWSPDGTRIAFQSFRNGVNSQIYVMNADGTGQVNISNTTANDIEPSWSPDGTKIAFASDRDQAGFSSIYVMNADGSNQTRLTSSGSGFLDEQPAWSPDGLRLAFTTTRDSTVVTWDEWQQEQLVVKTKLLINKEVYMMNADGSSQVRLTNVMGNDDSPVWSPDGTKIVFRSDRDRNCCDPVAQIWIMNVDGSNQINLSNSSFGDYCPSWSR